MKLELGISPIVGDLSNAKACNFRDKYQWNIIIFINKLHGNTGYIKIAEKINNLFLIEYLCTIIRRNTKGEIPPCEKDVYSFKADCICSFPLSRGMRLKIK